MTTVPRPGRRESHFCKLRKSWLHLSQQSAGRLPRVCPLILRSTKVGRPPEPKPGRIACIWCGRIFKIKLGIQVIGQDGRYYCSMKCLGEYLWTRRYDKQGHILPEDIPGIQIKGVRDAIARTKLRRYLGDYYGKQE
jgi:hypothetical protein